MAQVSIEYPKSHEALGWAKENCPSYITNAVDPISIAGSQKINPIKLIFYFSEEKDATLFALRWK